mgnify:FL=1
MRAGFRQTVLKVPNWFWVSLSCGLYWFAHSMTRPVIALYGADLGLTPSRISAILTVYAFVPMLLAIPGGSLADALGRIRVLRWGALLMVLSGCLYAAGRTFEMLLAAQLLAGVGQMAVWLVVQVLITDEEAGEGQHQRIATFSAYMVLGQLLAPLAGGFIADLAGYPAVFAAYLAICVLLCLAVWFCRETKAKEERHRAALPHFATMFAKSRRLLRNRLFAATLWCTFIVLFITDVRMTFLPLYLQPVMSNTELGSLVSAGALSGLFVRPLYPWLVRRFSYRAILSGTFAVSLGLLLFTPLLKHYIAFLVLVFVTGIALGINQPLTLSLISQSTPAEDRGLGVGLRLMANRGAQMLDPVLFGFFAAKVGMSGAFWLVGLFLLVCSAYTVYLFSRHDRVHEADARVSASPASRLESAGR